MNFLSHYCLDVSWMDDEVLLGTVLVDIARLRGKGFRLKPWAPGLGFEHVRQGIIRHYQVDAWWHNSRIFHNLTGLIKAVLAFPGLPPLPREYFFAHVGAEMLLDRVLMQGDPTRVDNYYRRLSMVSRSVSIRDLIVLSGNADWVQKVEQEWSAFLSSQFLKGYLDERRFAETVFDLHRRVTGQEVPAAIRQKFLASLPSLEVQFGKTVKEAGLIIP